MFTQQALLPPTRPQPSWKVKQRSCLFFFAFLIIHRNNNSPKVDPSNSSLRLLTHLFDLDQSNHFWPKERPGPERAKTKHLPARAALQMFPITGASSACTCVRRQSQHQIRQGGPSPPSPDAPSVTTSPKENKPAFDTSLHVQRPTPWAMGGRASPLPATAQGPIIARALLPTRWLRVPGGGALGLWGCPGGLGLGRRSLGVGAPFSRFPGADRRPPAPGWGRGRQQPRALGRRLGTQGQI